VASIAVTQAAFAGFGVLRRKPWAPLVWSVLYVGVMSGAFLLLGAAFIKALGKLATLGPKTTVHPAEILALLAAVAGGYLLLIVVVWVISAIINMAVVRAVLEPEAGAFAYLRLGPAELWLMLANFVLFILYTLVSMALAIPVSLASAIAVLGWRGAAPFISLPAQLITWGVTLWLGLRFCMVAPMIFSERRFRLFESWSFTRGHVWRLFGVGVVMVAASAVLYLALVAVGLAVAWPMVGQLASLGGTPQTFFAQSPQQIWRELAPFMALYAALLWIGSTILLPVFFAPWPEAYRQLTRSHLAATFG
jgi:hypothetical protein